MPVSLKVEVNRKNGSVRITKNTFLHLLLHSPLLIVRAGRSRPEMLCLPAEIVIGDAAAAAAAVRTPRQGVTLLTLGLNAGSAD